MKRIIESITSTSEVSSHSLSCLTNSLAPINIPKKTILIEPNRRNENIYFIEQGIARSYISINGREVTSWFSKEGQITYSTNSLHGKTVGYENEMVQILEDSLLYYMPIAELENLCLEHIDISNWIRKLYQHAFVEIERRLIYRLYMSAEERYNDFLEKNTDLFQRVNLGYIASYLGMSHVTLCALRK